MLAVRVFGSCHNSRKTIPGKRKLANTDQWIEDGIYIERKYRTSWHMELDKLRRWNKWRWSYTLWHWSWCWSWRRWPTANRVSKKVRIDVVVAIETKSSCSLFFPFVVVCRSPSFRGQLQGNRIYVLRVGVRSGRRYATVVGVRLRWFQRSKDEA